MNDDRPPRRPLRQDNGEKPLPPPLQAQVQAPEPRAWRLSDDLVMALRFFSRLPTGDRPFERPDLERMALALPFAGIIIGFLPVLLMLLAAWVGLPPWFAATLGVAAMAVATGAMAEDALADAADGLYGGHDIERRLAIMKDSRHGTYGVTALCLYIVLRIAALGALLAVNPLAAAGIWLATMLIGRSGALWLSVALPAARSGGASADAGRVSRRNFFIGAGFGLLLVVVLAAPFTSLMAVLLAVAAAVGAASAWTWTCRRLIGGQTGDLIGALVALIEVAALTVFMIFA